MAFTLICDSRSLNPCVPCDKRLSSRCLLLGFLLIWFAPTKDEAKGGKKWVESSS